MKKSKTLKPQDIVHVSGHISSWQVIEFVQGIRVHKNIKKSHVWKDIKSESNQIKNH